MKNRMSNKAPRACPQCHNQQRWRWILTIRKGFSVKIAILGALIGGLLVGPIGFFLGICFGALGKKKSTYHCDNCGFTFEFDAW